jgi:hypothetical protein
LGSKAVSTKARLVLVVAAIENVLLMMKKCKVVEVELRWMVLSVSDEE